MNVFYNDVVITDEKLVTEGQLDICPNTISVITGDNGCGKTLLLKNIMLNNSNNDYNTVLLDQDNDVTKVETADERYQKYLSNLKNNIMKKLGTHDGFYYYGKNIDKNLTIELKNDLNLEINLADDKKTISNVVNFYVTESGNGGCKSVICIKADGTITDVVLPCSDEDKMKVLENTSDYKNIVQIINGNFSDGYSGVADPIFIDIDGNMYSSNLN